MKRREFITLLGSAAVAWPLTARAQQPVPVVGWLSAGSPDSFGANVAAFRQGLAETGYIEDQNLAIEYRWSRDRSDQLVELAADLVSRKLAVLYAVSNASAHAAKSATSTIPIVFLTGGDPVEIGIIASISRPEGNATGVTLFLNELAAKRLELLREMIKPSINMSMTARGTSSASGTKCKDAAQTSSPETMSTGSWRCGVFGASADGRRPDLFGCFKAHCQSLPMSPWSPSW
jgi:putative ABC transport system substrate-binding protein